MDPSVNGISGSAVSGIQSRNQPISSFPNSNINAHPFNTLCLDQTLVNVPTIEENFVRNNFGGKQFVASDPPISSITSTSGLDVEDDHSEDPDFSDAVLGYINQLLMEEDMEDKTYMLQESLDLQAKEKSLYEALGKKYPPSPEPNPTFLSQNGESPEDSVSCNGYNVTATNSNSGSDTVDPRWINSPADYDVASLVRWAHNTSSSSVSSSNSINNLVDGFLDSPISTLQIPEQNESVRNFKKGVEEASKFLPDGNKLLNFNTIGLLPQKPRGEIAQVVVKEERKDGGDFSPTSSRGRKNSHGRDTVDLEEERSSKQAAIYTESTVRSEEFDIVLLHTTGKGEAALAAYRETLRTAKNKNMQQNGQPKGSRGRRGWGKKQHGKKEVIDLRTLLIRCAQAAAADDKKTANEMLKQIRQHSSPFGDGNQRLAHCFADGLEARLAGTGSQIYKALVNKRTSAADFLKAYHLYLASCPFRKISSFASNWTIRTKSLKSMRVHVIDFGILYGFQWPTFIQRIAGRKGGTPKIKITGIEFPQPGFRPAERIEETGHRLAEYAHMFNVPFEYNAIAKKWETIKIDDIKIEEDEFVVVNCLYRFKNLLDETGMVDSSRTIVLNLIRKINPNLFIHGIVNGVYSAPFFVTRFREALFHFSALFDMLENNVPREIPERMLIEKEIFGREALNVIACEGWERVERPETYKQWQARNLRAGFVQIPFDRELVTRATQKVTSSYHKDFVIDEDRQWMLLGWKGRIIYSLSCWQPV